MTESDYIKVGDVMISSFQLIQGLATVKEAMELMKKQDVDCLIIDRRHIGDEYGIVTVRDIASKVIASNRSPERTNVYEIMSKPVLAVDVDMNTKYAIRLLSRFQITHALVTNQGQMSGTVTLWQMTLHDL